MVPAFNDIKCIWVSLVEQDRRGFILIRVFSIPKVLTWLVCDESLSSKTLQSEKGSPLEVCLEQYRSKSMKIPSNYRALKKSAVCQYFLQQSCIEIVQHLPRATVDGRNPAPVDR